MNTIKIAHLLPDLLNLYGDGGNVLCLQKRCEWRNLGVEVVEVRYGQTCDFEDIDIVFFGGGPDREQKIASDQLIKMKEPLSTYIEEGGVLLAICGGYQILGAEWVMGKESIPGLGLLDITTRRPEKESSRLTGDIVLASDLVSRKIIGYENHAGRTYLGEGCAPFGNVVVGSGNNGEDKTEGIVYKHLIGSYLHGPLLSKNPEVSDLLLRWAADRRKQKGKDSFSLAQLDDSIENAAADFLYARLHI